MPKSCFDGYLTEGCKNCPYWLDGLILKLVLVVALHFLLCIARFLKRCITKNQNFGNWNTGGDAE